MIPLKAMAFLAAALAATSAPASAADLLGPAPLPDAVPLRSTIDEVGSGWYLRGDVGMTNQSVKRLSNSLDALGTIEKVNLGFDSSPFVGVGIGYQFSPWLRADITGEYRGKASFQGLERYRDSTLPLGYGTDEYTATKKELVFLANGYVDLGNWKGLTPFVGAGIGVAYNTIDQFRDTNVVTQGLAFAPSASKLNLAWALHAGLAYDIAPNLKVELAYRYLNLGDGKTGTVYDYAGRCAFAGCDNIKFKNIDSQDIKIGLRWLLAPPVASPVATAEPLMRRY